MVNAALLLRRPLFVTGGPGAGEGMPVHWSVANRSTLRGGLYGYDAIGVPRTSWCPISGQA